MTAVEISIGIPVYNGEPYLRSSIEALLAQTFTNWEIIVSDNASVDGTRAICEEYAARDPRIRYIRQPRNIGGPRNWNCLVEEARAPLFKWASANDLCDPEMLARLKSVLDEQPEVVLAYPKTKIIDGTARVTEEYEDGLHFVEDDPCDRFIGLLSSIGLNNAQNGLIRTAALRRTALEGVYQGGDVALMAELTLYGKFFEVPEFMFYRRVAADATTLGIGTAAYRAFLVPEAAAAPPPTWRLHRDLFGAVRRSPLTVRQKARLWWYLVRMLRWRRAELWAEIRASLPGRQASTARP